MKYRDDLLAKWEDEKHIPESTMNMVNFICEKIGLSQVEEQMIALKNRGGYTYGWAKGFTISYCTSSIEEGSSIDYSKDLLAFIKGLGFKIENSYGDNGMDCETNWHDTYWFYDFVYKPSEVSDDMFIEWEDSDFDN